MGQTASRNDQSKEKINREFVSGGEAVLEQSVVAPRPEQSNNSSTKYIGTNAIKIKTRKNNSQESAAAAQQLKQSSNWSLGSLSGRLNWSFTGTSRNSYRSRSKSTRKSLTSPKQKEQEDHLRRSKTIWHKPLTNAIFSSHFKESSRNEEFYIEDLIARGAFGVVFKVIDKRAKVVTQLQVQQKQLSQQKTKETLLSSSSLTTFSTLLSASSPPPLTSTTTKKFNESTTTTYALKVLKKSKIIEENSVQQLKDEADIQKICGHHPFIVQQIDLWQNRHNLHILSEFVPNGELFEKIAHFSIDLIRLYLAEIALALDFLHNAGIIYRDAKPENILLTDDYHIKLIDFGLSKWLKLGTTTKTMCGTFEYMGTKN